MHIRRFEASTMMEAVQKVKEELGPDALVLSTRTLRSGAGWFGLLGRSLVEVTAAADRDARPVAPAKGARPPAVEGAKPDRSWTELRTTRALVDNLEGEMRALRHAVRELGTPGWDASDALKELAELRAWTAELARGRPPDGEAGAARLARRLLAAGLAPRHAWPLAGAAAREAADEREERAALRAVLAGRFDRRMTPPRDDDVAPVELFVGPTGVGKTTTLAKLAAREAGAGGSVALLTTDTFRIGAEEQLRTYAELLGVPFGAAVSPEDLAHCLARRPARRVLVDTTGRGADREALHDLARLRAQAGEGARVSLVLPATHDAAQLRAELARYDGIRS